MVGESALGKRRVTERVDAAAVAADLKKMVLPFMKEKKLTILDLDNAGIQIAQRKLLADRKIKSTGFASLTIRDPDDGGCPFVWKLTFSPDRRRATHCGLIKPGG